MADDPEAAARAAATVGAQVSLAFDSDASLAARGVTADDIAGNSDAWDAAMVSEGMNPFDPSGDALDPDPPVNVEVPALVQQGTTLNCTMGTWMNTPTSYAYLWQGVAGSGPTYTVLPEDVGKTVTCTVVATNGAGSAAAPPSLPVTIT